AIRHLEIGAVLKLQLHEAALLVVQAGQYLVKLIGKFRRLGWRRLRINRLESFVHAASQVTWGRDFASDIPLFAPVKASLLLNLGQRDGAKQSPEVFTFGKAKLAGLGPPKECSANGLNHVLRPQTSSQRCGKVLAGERVE